MAGAELNGKYDRVIFSRTMQGYYGDSGYFNVGFWEDRPSGIEDACRRLTDRVLDALPATLGRVADIGCGLGAATARLIERHPESEVVAVNFSRSQLEACGRRCPTARLVEADAVCTGLPGASFDAVMSIEAALHFDTREAFFREAHRLLRPGGTLAMTDMLFTQNSWRGGWMIPEANLVAGVEEYRGQLAAAGFTAIAIDNQLEHCWVPFCHDLARWQLERDPSPEEAQKTSDWVETALEETTGYLFVRAEKSRE